MMSTIILALTPQEVTVIGDALSDMVDDLSAGCDSPLLLAQAQALLAKIETLEQTEVYPH